MPRRDLLPLLVAGLVGAALTLLRLALEFSGVQPVLNLTVSAPRGVYLVREADASLLSRGQWVRLTVPERFTGYVYGRRWLAPGTPLLKTVAGLPGDVLCVGDGHFTVNGKVLGPVFATDSHGLLLPVIRGCSMVPAGQFVPVSTFHPKSFDGRYMGAVPMALITGRASLLWTF
jgi:conjugative transfer signal peptidase TraF